MRGGADHLPAGGKLQRGNGKGSGARRFDLVGIDDGGHHALRAPVELGALPDGRDDQALDLDLRRARRGARALDLQAQLDRLARLDLRLGKRGARADLLGLGGGEEKEEQREKKRGQQTGAQRGRAGNRKAFRRTGEAGPDGNSRFFRAAGFCKASGLQNVRERA